MKIAINGFGRIGRIFFRQAFGRNGFDIVAVNDLGDTENLAYLLQYDTVYRKYAKKVEVKSDSFRVDGKSVQVLKEKDPSLLPWKELGVDVVVESTGFFTSHDKAEAHIRAGAKRVVISAPAKDEGKTVTATPNTNISMLSEGVISSNASCTTNAAVPIVSVLLKAIGIKKALLSTIHAYTATQRIVDGPDKDFTRGRAGAQNIIPSSTGAAVATSKALPEMSGIFDGIAMRVPVVSGSIVDLTFLASRETSAEEVNSVLREAAKSKEWDGIMTVSEKPLVSSDILGEPYAAIADLSFTRVIGGDLVKVLSWYDNEWGYCAMLMKHIEELKSLLK